MTRNTKLLGVAAALSFAAVLFFGLYVVRTTVWGTKNPDELLRGTAAIQLSLEEQDAPYFADGIRSLRELEEASLVVVKARVEGERVMSLRSTETGIRIETIYQDATGSLREGETVYLVEPFSIVSDEFYSATNGYQMVREGEEYLFFLNRLQAVEGYEFSRKERISFLPSTAKYSRYCLSSDETAAAIIRTGAERLFYRAYRDYALLSEDENAVSVYQKIREEIRQAY
ncbi:MAG: hypothetical protein LBQ15_00715 [Clostridium sp.]|jgi:hypothetical protein|nr:hypothetical protein [Clostridium sp.]